MPVRKYPVSYGKLFLLLSIKKVSVVKVLFLFLQPSMTEEEVDKERKTLNKR